MSKNSPRSDPSPPPTTPGLPEEWVRAGLWLFRWRSYLPLAVLALVLSGVALDPIPAGGDGALMGWVAAGMLSGVSGLLVRGWAVGLVPTGTSGRGTRQLRADSLNTSGVYSLVRHPLYLGNFLLWTGVTLTSGHPWVVLLVALLFWVYYERIMLAEEAFLRGRFGDAFDAWARRTPAFIPRLSGWTASPHRFNVRFALGRDYPALYAFVASTTAVEVTRSLTLGAGWRISAAWLAYFVAGTTAYVILHAMKRLTRALEAEDR